MGNMIDQLTEEQTRLDNDSVSSYPPKVNSPPSPLLPAKPGEVRNPLGINRKIDKRLLRSVVGALSPDEVGQALRDALTIAKSQRSSRGILEVVRFVVEYGVGAPIKRSISVSSTIEDMLREVMGGGDEVDVGDSADSGVVVGEVVGGEHEIGGGEDQEKRGEQDREPTPSRLENQTMPPSYLEENGDD